MLIEFTVKNFRSLKDFTTLSMEASASEKSKEVFNTDNGNRLLPIAAIFGPNASGKSNIVKALEFFRLAVVNSNNLSNPINSNSVLRPFMLDSKTSTEPSFFQAVFWDEDSKTEYRYGFEISRERVEKEWLEKTSKVKEKYTSKMLFTREKDSIELNGKLKKSLSLLLEKVLPGALVLNVFAQFAEEDSLRVFRLLNDHTFIYDGMTNLTQSAIDLSKNQPSFLKRLSKFLKQIDIPVGDLMITEKAMDADTVKLIPPALRKYLAGGGVVTDIETRHFLYDEQGMPTSETIAFSMNDHESLGTQKLFGFGAFVLQALDKGGVVIIDEFGNNIHPFISREIINIFRNEKFNKNHAQLIICSHDTYLLSNSGVGLRRDQIWFTEKDQQEATHLRALTDFSIRKDLSIDKNYLEGRLGAVPVTLLKD